MISGIENFDSKLQKAILEFIATNVDMSEDIEVSEVDECVISINDIKFYVITDDDVRRTLASYNRDRFDEFFEDLNNKQMDYVDEDKWSEENDIINFVEYIEEVLGYQVIDSDSYGSYNFYEIR